jgi:hypothetical protein
MVRYVVAFVLVLGLSGLGSPVLAQTPDGETPAVETDCDRLTGAARGLCNAYCEAQDCDEFEKESCEQLRDNFEKHTGRRIFPCDLTCEGLHPKMCRVGQCPPKQVCALVKSRPVCRDTGEPCDRSCKSICVFPPPGCGCIPGKPRPR